MTTRIVIACELDAPPSEVFEKAKTVDLLRYVSRPLVSFKPIDPPTWPKVWGEGEHLVGLSLFGLLPIGRQVIAVSFPPPDGDKLFIRDNGYSKMIKRWDHLITIEPAPSGTRYEDRLDLDAGFLTPIVAVFARVFYRHRQSRWRQLAAQGFSVEGNQ